MWESGFTRWNIGVKASWCLHLLSIACSLQGRGVHACFRRRGTRRPNSAQLFFYKVVSISDTVTRSTACSICLCLFVFLCPSLSPVYTSEPPESSTRLRTGSQQIRSLSKESSRHMFHTLPVTHAALPLPPRTRALCHHCRGDGCHAGKNPGKPPIPL